MIQTCGIIILAAGASTRLGKPKQLLPVGSQSLLSHTVGVAIKSKADHVIVVLGDKFHELRKKIDGQSLDIAENKDWKEGMASSIRTGLSKMLESYPDIDAIIFMVCDQPFISYTIINELIESAKKTSKKIVTCNYGENIGPPALFQKSYFSKLSGLKGDVGARKIIGQHMDDVYTIDFPLGKIDLDTLDDIDRFKELYK